jgi:hypothetical protein
VQEIIVAPIDVNVEYRATRVRRNFPNYNVAYVASYAEQNKETKILLEILKQQVN